MSEHHTGGNVRQAAAPQSVAADIRRAQALEFRAEGLGYAEIGARLGVATSTAHAYVVEALAEVRERLADSADEVRLLELRRLDDMFAAHWPSRANVRNAETLLRIMERRARMLGLDAPIAFAPMGSPPDPGDADLSLLTIEQLRELEGIITHAVKPAGQPVATIQPPDMPALLEAANE